MKRAPWQRPVAHTAPRAGHFGVLAMFVAFAAFPFYWMLITMFKQTRDLLNIGHNPFLFNEPPTLDNLRVLFNDTLHAQWLLNTGWVGVAVVVITPTPTLADGYVVPHVDSARRFSVDLERAAAPGSASTPICKRCPRGDSPPRRLHRAPERAAALCQS